MPRFAVLIHDHPYLHWDFLLESGSSCRTWRLQTCPDQPGEIAAECLPDHRLMYLEYQGPVAGNRGSVVIWDAGSFEWICEQSESVEVTLSGQKLNGIARLVRITSDSWTWMEMQIPGRESHP